MMKKNTYIQILLDHRLLYIYLNHFVVHLKLTQYCKSTTKLREKAWCALSLSHVWLFATLWTGTSVHGDSPGKNTGVGCLALLHRIFSTQRLNPGLPHCRWILYHLSNQGSPRIHIWKKKIYIYTNRKCWMILCSYHIPEVFFWKIL